MLKSKNFLIDFYKKIKVKEKLSFNFEDLLVVFLAGSRKPEVVSYEDKFASNNEVIKSINKWTKKEFRIELGDKLYYIDLHNSIFVFNVFEDEDGSGIVLTGYVVKRTLPVLFNIMKIQERHLIKQERHLITNSNLMAKYG